MKGEREEADTPAKPTDYVIIGNLRLVGKSKLLLSLHASHQLFFKLCC